MMRTHSNRPDHATASAAASRVLIAGMGNIFLGDDGFGTEVIACLQRRALPPHIELRDFGICGIDLAYALLDAFALVVLVDASARGGTPGTLYVIEPRAARADGTASAESPLLAAHELDPQRVLQVAQRMGDACARVLVLACEPESFGTEDDGPGRIGLSAAVAATVERAADKAIALAFEACEAQHAQPARALRPVGMPSAPAPQDFPRRLP
jgi:hydrogenase maturation protease